MGFYLTFILLLLCTAHAALHHSGKTETNKSEIFDDDLGDFRDRLFDGDEHDDDSLDMDDAAGHFDADFDARNDFNNDFDDENDDADWEEELTVSGASAGVNTDSDLDTADQEDIETDEDFSDRTVETDLSEENENVERDDLGFDDDFGDDFDDDFDDDDDLDEELAVKGASAAVKANSGIDTTEKEDIETGEEFSGDVERRELGVDDDFEKDDDDDEEVTVKGASAAVKADIDIDNVEMEDIEAGEELEDNIERGELGVDDDFDDDDVEEEEVAVKGASAEVNADNDLDTSEKDDIETGEDLTEKTVVTDSSEENEHVERQDLELDDDINEYDLDIDEDEEFLEDGEKERIEIERSLNEDSDEFNEDESAYEIEGDDAAEDVTVRGVSLVARASEPSSVSEDDETDLEHELFNDAFDMDEGGDYYYA